MITEIGIVAGAILNLLEEKKIPLSITEIRSYLNEPLELINMSIGWLIRESYVRVNREDQKYFALIEKDASYQETSKTIEYASKS